MCTHVLVEDSGVSAQVLRLGHQVVQFLPSLQEALHGVVLRAKAFHHHMAERQQKLILRAHTRPLLV